MKNRAGEYKVNLSGELQYRSFVPTHLTEGISVILDDEAVTLLANAYRNLGLLEGLSRQIPDMYLFVSMYIRKEALLSSQIEGTQATLDDILDPYLEENSNLNVADVVNYINASQFAERRLKELPICNRLLREIHEILIKDGRGGEKYPGEFRRSQNWIGPAGSNIKNARYIPPNPEDMGDAMSDLETYIHQSDSVDALVKTALIHYQFETIHPFLDGNGRIGRMLITLFFMERQLLSYPSLYISYFLKRNRIEYYDRLMEVREKGNYEQWIKFFLRAVWESAQDAIDSIEKLIKLHDGNLAKIQGYQKSLKSASRIFAYLEQHPIIEIKKTSKELGMAFNTASNAVNILIKLGILQQTVNAKRNRVFAYEDYLKILRKDTEL